MKWGLGLWFLLIGLLVAYVIADGFFDLSNQIRSWARPLWRAAWGAVVGVARKRAAPAAPVTGHVGTASADSGSHMDQSAPVQTPPNNPIRLPSITSVLGWFWKYKAALLIVAAFLFVFGLLRGCDLNPFGSSPDRLRLERDMAEAEVETQETINDRDQDIAAIDRDLALMRQQLQNLAQRGRDEIAAAAPDDEAPIDPELVAAFRNSLDRMCVPRADGTRADSCE